MATIAKSSITLVSISDAYSVSLQPSNITINADPYGNNAKLDNAFTIISLYCGDLQVPISNGKVINSSLWKAGGVKQIDCQLESSGSSLKLSITKIGSDLSGWREVEIFTNAGQRLTARFSYTVVRETTMLDWILEWDKNLTEISGDHVATPNAFIGNKGEDGTLTGVYIGGGENHPYLPGIYGFKGCAPEGFAQGNLGSTEIFHLNETGGMIGGWEISNTGLIKENPVGRLEILSEGTIRYVNILDATTPFWELKNDGSGSFASGHITWDTSGNATFDGKIKAQSGEIGGWTIGDHSLYNSAILLDSANSFIGVRNRGQILFIGEPTSSAFYDTITRAGGVALHYSDSTHYGLEGWIQGSSNGLTYNKGSQIFSLGSKNFIAGWNISANALWRGGLVNTAGSYTDNSGDITIGAQGIRGYRWYIDADGEASFANDSVHFNPNGIARFSGTIESSQIIGGSISAIDIIQSEDGQAWFFKKDGSGQLANGNIVWGIDGRVNVSGGLRADTFELKICSTFSNGYIDGSTGSFISPESGATATLILPILNPDCARIFHLMIPKNNEKLRIGFSDSNVSFLIPGQENIEGSSNESAFDEDGFTCVQGGFGGEWCELIGIKTTLVRLQSLFPNTKWNQVTASHIWNGTQLIPIKTPKQVSTSAIPTVETMHTYWFMLPKSSRLHWFIMASMGLTL